MRSYRSRSPIREMSPAREEEDWPRREEPATRRPPCPNCGRDHPLRYCPCPNTEDGRLQACVSCNTTDHAWFTCDDYEPDHKKAFSVAFMGRLGLCPLVHNVPLHIVWAARFYEIRDSWGEQSRDLFGPSTPQFVMRMLTLGRDDPEIGRQMDEGRVLPWDLDRANLTKFAQRVRHVVLDPTTNPMSEQVIFEGTATRRDNVTRIVPAQPRPPGSTGATADSTPEPASPVKKEEEAQPLPADQISLLQPSHGLSEMQHCHNCKKPGHVFGGCKDPCSQCHEQLNTAEHMEEWREGQRCRYLCWCGEEPGHAYTKCPRPCRACVEEKHDTAGASVGQCGVHCHVHPRCAAGEDETDHHDCATRLRGECPTCGSVGEHWGQDCPAWLRGMCMERSCRKDGCAVHCLHCGMEHLADAAVLPGIQGAYGHTLQGRDAIERLSSYWHDQIHRQWERVDAKNVSHDVPWTVLRCINHADVELPLEKLKQIRANTLLQVVREMRADPAIRDPTQCQVLQLPECPRCFAEQDEGTWLYEDRRPRT